MSLESKILQWNQYQLVGETDLNNISKFIVDTIFRDLNYFMLSKDVAIVSEPNIILQDTGSNYVTKIDPFFGIDKIGTFLINKTQQTINHPTPVTNPRIDIIQCRKVYTDQASQTRNFIDPTTGIITPQTTYTELGINVEVVYRAGAEAGTPIAPAVDVGWTKLGEIFVDTTGGIATADIFNVNQYFSEDNTGWTLEKQSTKLYKDLQAHRTSALLDHPNKSVTEAHLSDVVQSKLNASASGGTADVTILNNLLNVSRDNESMEYFFGTGLDTDYTLSKELVSTYKDNLLNDEADASAVDEYDDNNTVGPQSMGNLSCDVVTSLFDVYLDAVKVMTAVNTDYDWTLEQITPAISTGLISLRPQTTWTTFTGTSSTSATDKKIIGANDGGVGLELVGGGLTDIELLYDTTAFNKHFNGTSLNIVITKDGQVYKWDGVGNPVNALTKANFVFGYEMFLTADASVGGSRSSGSGENDAGWAYRKISTNRHRVYTPENYSIQIGAFNDADCVGVAGDKYYDEYSSKAYTMKTQIVLSEGFALSGKNRFLSILKFDETETEWVDWACFKTEEYSNLDSAFGTQNPCQITWAGHPLVDGDYVVVSNSSAIGEVPNDIYPITWIDANTFSIDIDNSGGGGGTCDLVAINNKKILLDKEISMLCESSTTTPIQIIGCRDSIIDLFDIETVATTEADGYGSTRNIKVHEEVNCDNVDLNTLHGKGLEELLYL